VIIEPFKEKAEEYNTIALNSEKSSLNIYIFKNIFKGKMVPEVFFV